LHAGKQILSGRLTKVGRWLRKGQSTVEYVLIMCVVGLPLSLAFFKFTQRFFAGLLVNIVNGFPGQPTP